MKKKTAIQKIKIIALSISILLPVLSCIKKKSSDTQTDVSQIKTIVSMTELNQIINNNNEKMLVLDLYADWCVPCKILSPIFNSLSQTHKDQASFFRVDVDKSPEIAEAFGVQGIPYVVFIRNKKAIYTLTGVNPKENYEKVLNSCSAAESEQACTKLLESM